MKHGSIMGYMGILDLPIHQKNKWLYEISQGMQYLHESSIVHGDLKATNILVADNGQLKISDFGLAVFEGNWSRNFGSQCGENVRWMAPEILSFHAGQHQWPTYASDVYSFAMVCIEIYTRKIPFQDIKWNQGETLEMLIIGGKRPSIPASMSEELSSHLVTWWHGSPE
ncbi:unnamed protein product [Somion occarium]|uniref:Protein kinase domain-containing protein n=1 Tax=Somion occarium TaxID=3059160 RepID=A0ABP1CH27_9APHY